MRSSGSLFIGVILIFSLASYSANLETSPEVNDFLASSSSAIIPATADLATPGILGSDKATERPVLYKVDKAAYSKDRLVGLASITGMQVDGNVSVSGDASRLINSAHSACAGYDGQRGRYFYYNKIPQSLPLSKTDPASCIALKEKAQQLLSDALGSRAVNYVFANTETDSVKTNDTDPGVIAKLTFRFTRKLNGRHIVDNTAYFKATYAGAQELCAFEFTDPHLEPVALDLMVLPSATPDRLAEWANDKNTAVSPTGDKIGVIKVIADKPIESYMAQKNGASTFLVPYLSFFSKICLENGRSYDKYIDLCLDAGRTPNLKPGMIENTGR
jgi:hypothetical protein